MARPRSRGVSVCRKPWHLTFVALLPRIRDYVLPAFGQLRGDDREEAVQEAIAQAFVIFVRLMKRGRPELIFPTVLAGFAIRRVRGGRTLGTPLNSHDVMSAFAQRKRKFVVGRLDGYDRGEQRWLEAVVLDYQTPIPDQVAFRIDYPAWLSRLNARKRRIAKSLADGHSTAAVAKRFHLSPARISQVRRELHASWEQFHAGPFRAANSGNRTAEAA